MEFYKSHCPGCNKTYRWIGYKTEIGKAAEQLKKMHEDETICKHCGSKKLKTELE